MNAQQLHPQPAARTLPNSDFIPMRLNVKALNDDCCWDEFESDFEESLPSQVFSFADEDGDRFTFQS
jgi:hypothetical protein